MSLIFLEKIRRGGPLAPLEEIRRGSPLITSHLLAQRRNTAEEGPLATEFLIATVAKLEFESSHCKQARYQNSNRNKNAFSGNVARVFRPEAFRRSSFVTSVLIHHPALLLAAPHGGVCNLPGHRAKNAGSHSSIHQRLMASLCSNSDRRERYRNRRSSRGRVIH